MLERRRASKLLMGSDLDILVHHSMGLSLQEQGNKHQPSLIPPFTWNIEARARRYHSPMSTSSVDKPTADDDCRSSWPNTDWVEKRTRIWWGTFMTALTDCRGARNGAMAYHGARRTVGR